MKHDVWGGGGGHEGLSKSFEKLQGLIVSADEVGSSGILW